MKPKEIRVHDTMQKEYTYELTEPAGKNFDPRFQPELTPKEMLELGVFGGSVYERLRRGISEELVCACQISNPERLHAFRGL